MQHKESITTQPRSARPGLASLRPGDYVLVYDGVKERETWQRVAELRTAESGRLKLRVEDTDFFFDEGLVIRTMRSEPTPPPAASPFTVNVLHGPHGSIGVFVPLCVPCHTAERREAA